jgi:hypothetical protein
MYSGEYDSKGRRFDVVRHIFQACPVWIYTQSNIASIIPIFFRHYMNMINLPYKTIVKIL